MSEINVQLNDGPAAQLGGPITVAEALKKLDRDTAKQALAARVNGREVDLAFLLDQQQNGDPLKIEPVLPETLEGLDVLRHSTAHLLAAAVLDLFPGTKLGIGPALLDDPRYGYFYDVITPKIRDAQMQKVPFMLVLGDREMEQGTVAVRERSQGDIGVMPLADFKEMARKLVEMRALTNT